MLVLLHVQVNKYLQHSSKIQLILHKQARYVLCKYRYTWYTHFFNVCIRSFMIFYSLFRNKSFMFNKMLQRNASKFAIAISMQIFSFFIMCCFSFSPSGCPGPWSMLTQQIWAFIIENKINQHEMKNEKKNTLVALFQKYDKF